MLGWLAVLFIGLVALFYLLTGSSDPIANNDAGLWIYVAMLSALALLFGLSMADDYRGRFGTALRHAATWIALLLVLVGIYAYRDEAKSVADRMAGELLPGRAMSVGGPKGEASVRLRKRDDGHFVARINVDGHELPFMVDTGASSVVLTSAAAAAAGVETSALKFTIPVQTANGSTYTAPVLIRSMSIGPIQLNDIEALVAQPGDLNENLLGMSFLKRLRSYEASGDFLTLRG
jgi:aspartyl protease family protein